MYEDGDERLADRYGSLWMWHDGGPELIIG
jgi:hypothetical protein